MKTGYRSRVSAIAVLGALFASLALAATGCAAPATIASVSSEDDVYLTASGVPVNIEAYPSTWYDGHLVYFWNDAWVFRNQNGWAYVPAISHSGKRRVSFRDPRPDARDTFDAARTESFSSSAGASKHEVRSGSDNSHRENKNGK